MISSPFRFELGLRLGVVGVIATLLVGYGERASAQTYPSRPIQIVVTTAPGGAADTLARQIGNRLSERLGQPVIIDNKPGANTQLAASYVAKSAPDGYTLLLGPDVTFVVNPHLYSKLSYDPVNDFVPVSGLVVLYQAMMINPSLPVENVAGLIALAKAKPKTINYGTFGNGSSAHLNMEMFQSVTGVELTAVHYRGAAPALTDVIAGHIQMMFVSFGSAAGAWKAGKVKAIAVGSPRRIAQYPDLPTFAEIGIADFEAKSWFGLFAPRGTPREIVDKLHVAVQAILAEQDLRERFLAPSIMEPMTQSADAYADLIRNENVRWGKVIRERGLKAD